MSERRPYSYVLLRYRHDPLAGEFANVGVVLHAPAAAFLEARVRTGQGPRLKAMFPTADREALLEALRVIARGVRSMGGRNEGGDLLSGLSDAEAFARRALPVDDTSFVWSPPGSGLTADPARTLDKLYDRFVTQYDEARAKPQRDDAAVWRPVFEKLIERQVADRLRPKTIRSPTDEVEFEHAWKNGAWHVYQPVSLDLASSDNIRAKAARWLGHGTALAGSPEAFKLHFLVGEPSQPELRPDYQRALAMLRLSPGEPDVVEETDAERLVAQIEHDIRSHDGAPPA